MKCNLYEANTGSPLAVAFLAAIDTSDNDSVKAALHFRRVGGGADELKAFASLTGFECHKPSVKFGKLKVDWCASPRQPQHAQGSGVIVAEVANGIRFAVLDAITPADLAAAAASHADDKSSSAGNAPSAPGVIVPPVPPDAAPGVTDVGTGSHETKPD